MVIQPLKTPSDKFTDLSPPLMEAILASLRQDGYALLSSLAESLDSILVALAHNLGTPQPARRTSGILDVLAAVDERDAPPNSLSSRYGMRAFPFHTDDAVEVNPARWLLLAEIRGGSAAPTRLVDGKILMQMMGEAPLREAREAPFFVVNGARSFITTVVCPNNLALRWDLSVMRPTGPRSRELRQFVLQTIDRLDCLECNWKPGRILVIDNHRMLHARGQVTRNAADEQRVLLRVLTQEAQ